MVPFLVQPAVPILVLQYACSAAYSSNSGYSVIQKWSQILVTPGTFNKMTADY